MMIYIFCYCWWVVLIGVVIVVFMVYGVVVVIGYFLGLIVLVWLVVCVLVIVFLIFVVWVWWEDMVSDSEILLIVVEF